jgi:hypothetical protein
VYIFIIFALGLFVIALYYTIEGVIALQQGDGEGISYQLITGLFGVAVSGYMIYQFRQRMTMIKPSTRPNLTTVIECKQCNFKNLRKFVKGDYIFKSEGLCQKCNESMLITGIYAEKAKK